MTGKITGLVAATHTPFTADGDLQLAVVEKQAAHLLANGVTTVFVGGSTGESHSLTVDERLQLAARWFEVARGSALSIVVHVGSNGLHEARMMAAQAQLLGASAIAALSPSYFKPANVEALLACTAHIAQAAPETPFYFYDIPSLTGVHLSMPEYLRRVPEKIPHFAGLKFTNVDLVAFQLCRDLDNQRYDILWGVDEMLLAALAFGATGAVGSTYNFAAPLYHRLIQSFQKGDLEAARREQLRSVQLVNILVKRGYMASAKAFMTMLGVDVGPPRLPHMPLDGKQTASLREELSALGML